MTRKTMEVGTHIFSWEPVFNDMKKFLVYWILLFVITGCRDKMNEPVGLDEVPKNIPKPLYVGDLQADSTSNFVFAAHAGISHRLWIGDAYSFDARVLLRFSVSDSVVLADADSAKVTVYVYNGLPLKSIKFNVFPVTKKWDEETVEWGKATADSEWSKPGGDFADTVITGVVLNDTSETFTLNYDNFALFDSSNDINKGLIFVYELGDTLLSIYSSESSNKQPKLTVFYGDSSKDYAPEKDAFITNSTYDQPPGEIVLGEGFSMRALLFFNLDTIPKNVTVNRAFISFGFLPSSAHFDTVTVYLHRVTGLWNGSETEYYSSSIANFVAVKGDTALTTDVTSLLQYWINGGDNYGILLRARNETSICSRLILDAIEKPTLSIYYTPSPGAGE